MQMYASPMSIVAHEFPHIPYPPLSLVVLHLGMHLFAQQSDERTTLCRMLSRQPQRQRQISSVVAIGYVYVYVRRDRRMREHAE